MSEARLERRQGSLGVPQLRGARLRCGFVPRRLRLRRCRCRLCRRRRRRRGLLTTGGLAIGAPLGTFRRLSETFID